MEWFQEDFTKYLRIRKGETNAGYNVKLNKMASPIPPSNLHDGRLVTLTTQKTILIPVVFGKQTPEPSQTQ